MAFRTVVGRDHKGRGRCARVRLTVQGTRGMERRSDGRGRGSSEMTAVVSRSDVSNHNHMQRIIRGIHCLTIVSLVKHVKVGSD